MAVKVGSARSDERGKATGGKAGDQNSGKEVSTQNWYRHSKGWRVFRPNSIIQAKNIAKCMQMACDNNNIGYDQYQRNTLYKQAEQYNFDVSKVKVPTETDCSALVRVCCAYAGIESRDFNTSSQASALLATGAFTELKNSKYTNGSDYLREGDVLVTKTKGHTVVVLTSGPDVEDLLTIEPIEYRLGNRNLRNGTEGADVKELQSLLIQLGYNLGRWGADGDFGDTTEIAVRQFQADTNLEVDGIVGAKTLKEIEKMLADKVIKNSQQIRIINGNCYVRQNPDVSAKAIGTAQRNEVYFYLGQKSEEGWHKIEYKNQTGWVSGKYSELI